MKSVSSTAMLAIAATIAAATAFPSAAQTYRDYDRYEQGRYAGEYERRSYEGRERHHGGQWNGAGRIQDRQTELRRAIDRGERRGRLTSAEASVLRRQLTEIRLAAAHYRANGLTPRERASLDRQLDRMERRVNRLTDREYGYGYGVR